MSLLDMIPERDRAELRRNLFASAEFFNAVNQCLSDFSEGDFAARSLDRAFERHGFQPSDPAQLAALRESLEQIEGVIRSLETRHNYTNGGFRFGPEVREMANPLRSAVERLQKLISS